MRLNWGKSALARAGLLAAVAFLQFGCAGLESARREREGQAALDKVRLRGVDNRGPGEAPRGWRERAARQADSGRESSTAKAPKPSPQERNRDEAIDDLRGEFARQAQDGPPGAGEKPEQ